VVAPASTFSLPLIFFFTLALASYSLSPRRYPFILIMRLQDASASCAKPGRLVQQREGGVRAFHAHAQPSKCSRMAHADGSVAQVTRFLAP
jgi:hypothetical protein